MKIKLQKKDIQAVAKRLLPYAKTSVLPILENFLMRTWGDNQMSISCSNLEIYGTATIPCEDKEESNFCINAQKLTQIVEVCNDNITLDYDKEKRTLKISSGKSVHKLATESAEDFPAPDNIESGKEIKVSEIQKIMKRTIPAVCKDELRGNMRGIFIGKSIVGTNGFTLVESPIEPQQVEPSIIIPMKVANIVAGCEGEVLIEYTESDIRVKNGNYTFQSKLIDETFPNYENVIPKEKATTHKVTLNTEAIKTALRSAIITSDSVTHRVIMQFKENGILVIKTTDDHSGSAAQIELDYTMEGSQTELPAAGFSFNIGYLLNVLEIITEDTVTLNLIALSTGKPLTIRTKEFVYLIMPLRTTEPQV
jgi:DNA polymerase-3 subunit beta